MIKCVLDINILKLLNDFSEYFQIYNIMLSVICQTIYFPYNSCGMAVRLYKSYAYIT
jgi:hypothetical protein